MAKYRDDLPQLSDDLFLTDGGIETTLIFHYGLELPHFAAFDLLKSDEGRRVLRKYYRTYASIAQNHRVGFVLESVTWRASPDWGKKLGYSIDALADMNHEAIELVRDVRDEFENEQTKMVISGCIGPRGDGYDPSQMMTEQQAEQYHIAQVGMLSETDVDMVSALTMTHEEEAIGIVRAAGSTGIPVVVSFTVETDGRLPTGGTLRDAIEKVDEATGAIPAYYMINCAHPTHFEGALATGETWARRIRGIRANASTKSHAELDEAEELDDGNPVEFGAQYSRLRERFDHLSVLGGCCGTDHRHIEEIITACAPRS